MSKETYAEQLARVRGWADESCDMHRNDKAAIAAVLARLDALEKPVTAEDVSRDLVAAFEMSMSQTVWSKINPRAIIASTVNAWRASL